MTDRDRKTPRDPLPAARVPRPAHVAPESREGAETDEQLKRSAVSALRKVGAQRGQVPQAPYRPRIETLHGSPAPPSERSRTPESGGVEVQPRRPPPVEIETVDSIAPKSADIDRSIGKLVRLLLRRYGWQAVLTLGVGAVALKPAATPEKADATAVRVTNAERALDAQAKRTQAIEDYARELARVNHCLRRQQGEANEAVLPAPDHMGSARRPQPWGDFCPEDPKPP